MSGRVEFEFSTKTQAAYRTKQSGPLRILVLGDFSGRSNRGLLEPASLAERPIVSVDVDNFEDLLFGFAPRLHLPAGSTEGPGMALEFKSLEDFHPDTLFDRLELFGELRKRRQRLLDPATFEETASELRRWAGEPETSAAPDDGTAEATPSDDLERLLGQRPAALDRTGPQPAQRLDLDGIIRRLVEPHIVSVTDADQAPLVAALDEGIAEQMRGLLHHEAFQELEAAWRSVHDLVSGTETGEDLKLYLLDVSREELAADLAGDDPTAWGLQRAVVERSVGGPGDQPWSLLVGNYAFGPDSADLNLLARLGHVASQAGGPFLAAADPSILGCAELTDHPEPRDWRPGEREAAGWAALRATAAAAWIGLTLPRLLLRLPYGQAGEEIDRFAFEELAGGLIHDHLLWGNGAFGCAGLIARAFLERGWEMQPGDFLDVHDLPAFIHDDDGERKLKPCAEVLLSERAGTAILENGLMPFLSYKDRNAARLMRFQSIASPSAGLPGAWGGA